MDKAIEVVVLAAPSGKEWASKWLADVISSISNPWADAQPHLQRGLL